MRPNESCSTAKAAVAVMVLLAATLALQTAQAAPKFKVLHAFDPVKHGLAGVSDGVGLYDRLTLDAKGNLYGTTAGGGTYNYGTVFELMPNSEGHWTEAILHNFNDRDGDLPHAGLVFDAAGNLYGRTITSVFKLKPSSGGWTLSVLFDHGGPSNLLLDRADNVYGSIGKGEYGQGAISELVRKNGWKEKWLYSFCSRQDQKGLCLDGSEPSASLTWGPGGVLYGTTVYGGDSPYCGKPGCGVVYELKPEKDGSWNETVLHSFPAFNGDGWKLYDGVTLDKSGNLYGATYQGGSVGCGVIFKLSRRTDRTSWDETVLHDFPNTTEGCIANTLTFDKKGNLWGTAESGGTGHQCSGGCGVVFKMTADAKGTWKYNVVHDFTGSDGALPSAAVIFDKHGNLYGTTVLGGPGHSVGVVFEITP